MRDPADLVRQAVELLLGEQAGVSHAAQLADTGLDHTVRPLLRGLVRIDEHLTGRSRGEWYRRKLKIALQESAIAISLGADYLGSGLQRARTVSTPSAPAPAGGTPITITAARTGVVQFAPDANTAGVDTLVVVVPEGLTSASFYVQAADGIAQDSVVLTAPTLEREPSMLPLVSVTLRRYFCANHQGTVSASRVRKE